MDTLYPMPGMDRRENGIRRKETRAKKKDLLRKREDGEIPTQTAAWKEGLVERRRGRTWTAEVCSSFFALVIERGRKGEEKRKDSWEENKKREERHNPLVE